MVSAVNDGTVEGFHTEYIRFDVSSDDQDETKGPFVAGQVVKVNGTDVTAVNVNGKVWLQVDGDLDDPGIQAIPGDKPAASCCCLTGRWLDRCRTHCRRGIGFQPLLGYGNTVTFLTSGGAPESRSGKVEVNYQYKEAGYDGYELRDQVVDIYDNDTPTVIILPAGDGMIDVVENDDTATDTYTVRLASAPTQNVYVVIDSVKTRTTWGANAYFEKQVLLSDSDETDEESITLMFTPLTWNIDQIVTVRALDDNRLDGNDTQVFAPICRRSTRSAAR